MSAVAAAAGKRREVGKAVSASVENGAAHGLGPSILLSVLPLGFDTDMQIHSVASAQLPRCHYCPGDEMFVATNGASDAAASKS